VRAACIDASFQPTGGDFQVKQHTEVDQQYQAIATLWDGSGFVVAWSSYEQDGEEWGVYARLYGPDCQPKGPEFNVGTATVRHQLRPSVASFANGEFIVGYESYGVDGSGYAAAVQRCSSAGAPIGSLYHVYQYTTSSQLHVSLASNRAGDEFVIAWGSYSQPGGESTYGVVRRRFTQAGEPLTDEELVNVFTEDNQFYPRVSYFPGDDGYLVTWASWRQDGRRYGVYAQGCDGSDNRIGTEFRVNVFTEPTQP